MAINQIAKITEDIEMGPEPEKHEVGDKSATVSKSALSSVVRLREATLTYEDTPSAIGYYWLKNWCSSKPPRIVRVLAYQPNHDGRFFTSEDVGASVHDDEMYPNHRWAGPIPEPTAI